MNQVWRAQAVGFGLVWVNIVLAALKTRAAAALVNAGMLRLSADDSFNPTQDSTVAELAAGEIDFSGYPAGGAAVTLSDPLILSAQCAGVLASAVFLATTASPFVDAVATGWWIDDGTNVICYERFPADQRPSFGMPGAWLDLDALLPLQLLQLTV